LENSLSFTKVQHPGFNSTTFLHYGEKLGQITGFNSLHILLH
jgi:hypothetical protein